MTAEEIRGMELRTDMGDYETKRNGVRMLREIAAQLAELNENLRSVISTPGRTETLSSPMIRVSR